MPKPRVIIVSGSKKWANTTARVIMACSPAIDTTMLSMKDALSHCEKKPADVFIFDDTGEDEAGMQSLLTLARRLKVPFIVAAAQNAGRRASGARVDRNDIEALADMAIRKLALKPVLAKIATPCPDREQLLAMFEAAAEGILVVDADRNILMTNSRFASLWRIPKKSALLANKPGLRRHLLSMIKNPTSLSRRINEINRSAQSASALMALNDGRFIEASTRPMKIKGRPAGRIWSFSDVTRRVRSEEKSKKLNLDLEKKIAARTRQLTAALEKVSLREMELSHSEEIFRGAFDTAPHGMDIVDTRGKFVRVNKSFCSITGYTSRELIGKSITTLTHPDDREKSGDYFQKLIREEIQQYQIEKRYLHKKGHPVWVLLSASLVTDRQGDPMHVLGQVIDITRAKKAQWILRDSEEMYRRLFDEAIDSIFVADITSGIIVDCNRAAEDLLGMEKKEIIGMHQKQLHPPDNGDDRLGKSFVRGLQGARGLLIEERVLRRDGSLRHVAIKSSQFDYKGMSYCRGIFTGQQPES